MENARIEYAQVLYGEISALTAELEGVSSKTQPLIYETITDEISRLQKETLELYGEELKAFIYGMVEFDDFDTFEDKIEYTLQETWGGCCEIKNLDGTEIVTNDYFVLITKNNKVLYYLER